MGWMLVFLPNVIWPFLSRLIFRHTVSFVEVFIQLAVVITVLSVGKMASEWSALQDVEVWNGYVVDKKRVKTSCEHSYDCMCTTSCSGSGANRSCYQVCQTCYDHSYDVDWVVNTTIGRYYIDRLSRQGLEEPPRWTKVAKKDPVSKTSLYDNYILAAPHSLFNFENSLIEKYANKIPSYPSRVYDYYHVDRVLNLGVPSVNAKVWSAKLQERLSTLGGRKKVNAIILLTGEPSYEYADAVRAAWKGGKKNDVILVISVDKTDTVRWARVLSWSKKELFKIQLQDEIRNQGQLSMPEVLDSLEKHILVGFEKMNMAEYEYLKEEMKPSPWAVFIMFVICALVNGLCTYVAHRNDLNPRSLTDWIHSIRRNF